MKDLICQHFNIDADQILGCRETENAVIVVINYGILGGKKFEVSKADLKPKPAAKPTAKPAAKPAAKATAKKSAAKKKASK